MLEIKNLSVAYSEVHALRNVSFRVSEGQIVALIGSNGAGKSTTLKAIAGLVKPTQGDLEFCGSPLSEGNPAAIVEKGIALVPEGRRLFTKMTVLENLEMGALIARARTCKEESLEEVYNLFPILHERKHQLAGTLSGGQQQMLSISRALMTRPKLCMFDEPSLGIAPKVITEIFGVITKLREKGTTVLIVEQNVQQVLRICDYAYVLENGEIALADTGDRLLGNDLVQKAYLGI